MCLLITVSDYRVQTINPWKSTKTNLYNLVQAIVVIEIVEPWMTFCVFGGFVSLYLVMQISSVAFHASTIFD